MNVCGEKIEVHISNLLVWRLTFLILCSIIFFVLFIVSAFEKRGLSSKLGIIYKWSHTCNGFVDMIGVSWVTEHQLEVNKLFSDVTKVCHDFFYRCQTVEHNFSSDRAQKQAALCHVWDLTHTLEHFWRAYSSLDHFLCNLECLSLPLPNKLFLKTKHDFPSDFNYHNCGVWIGVLWGGQSGAWSSLPYCNDQPWAASFTQNCLNRWPV